MKQQKSDDSSTIQQIRIFSVLKRTYPRHSQIENSRFRLSLLSAFRIFVHHPHRTILFCMKKDIILSDQDIRLRVRRIAYQIYESNLDEETVFVVGIANSGYRIATLIADELEKITPSRVRLVRLEVNKKDLYAPFILDVELEQMAGKPVVLVDDVLNSGTVLIHAVRHLLSVPLKKLNTAVLVDRNHKLYPVKVDFKGLSLSTSMHEHVDVVFEKDGSIHACLN